MAILKKLTAAVSVAILSATLSAQAPVPASPAIEKRIGEILSKLSLDDKLALLGGEDEFYTHAVPAAGVKRLKMSDGPVGVRTYGPATAYTASVGLAASWDAELAEAVGASLGDDARARGVHFLLAPGVNIYRSPLNGRNMEYMGEDPYLAGRIAVGYIRGVQSKGVSATVKHFAANNSDYDRHRINAVIDERTLRELYLPAFEAAVKQAKVTAVMDSYNLVNGDHSTQNEHLNVDILKKEWGFQGLLMSDWNSTYDGVAAANHGLDLEMPSAKAMNAATLKAALQDGRIRQSTIDDKVRRFLRIALQYGWLDREQTIPSIPLNNPAGDKVALREALESVTLLKNEGGLLPLDARKVHTLAILGPEAAAAVVGGGGSSRVTTFEAQSFVAGFSAYLGDSVKVMYVPGLPTVDSICRRTEFRNLSLETQVEGERAKSATPKEKQRIALWPKDTDSWPQTSKKTTYRWSGDYTPATSGEYFAVITSPGMDAYRLRLNGKDVLTRAAGVSRYATESTLLPLTAGKTVKVELEYSTFAADPHISLGLKAKEEMLTKESQQILHDADAALVTVGFNVNTEGEAFDRPYMLTDMQNQLIRLVAEQNRNTIVSISAGGAIETESWLSKVPAVLHNYYPGQEGARALAEIVFGEHSPEGHLPFSWERVYEDNPTSSHYQEEAGTKDSHYAEGLYVGYRYYTSMKKKPLYPFGFGLSYTTFTYSGLTAKRNSADDVEVAFDVQNTGTREGATVAQVYVGDPSAKVARPARELKQFSKLNLKAGEKQHVVLHLDRRAFQYYDVNSKGWKLDPGAFTIAVGESSENLAQEQGITLE